MHLRDAIALNPLWLCNWTLRLCAKFLSCKKLIKNMTLAFKELIDFCLRYLDMILFLCLIDDVDSLCLPLLNCQRHQVKQFICLFWVVGHFCAHVFYIGLLDVSANDFLFMKFDSHKLNRFYRCWIGPRLSNRNCAHRHEVSRTSTLVHNFYGSTIK